MDPDQHTVKYKHISIIYFRMEQSGFSVNSVGISLPYGKDGVFVRAVSNIMYRVSLDIGLDILWDGKNRVEVQLESHYHGKVSTIKMSNKSHTYKPESSPYNF